MSKRQALDEKDYLVETGLFGCCQHHIYCWYAYLKQGVWEFNFFWGDFFEGRCISLTVKRRLTYEISLTTTRALPHNSMCKFVWR